MCRSRAQGGQRCFSHATQVADRAYDRFSVALADRDGDPSPQAEENLTRARDVMARAQEDLASTAQGRARLVANIANPLMQTDRVTHFQQVLTAGDAVRDRNAALRAAHADGAAGRAPLATGTDRRLDQSIGEARDIVVANMATARTPTPGVRIAKVKTYATPAEQQAGLAARERTLHAAEFDFSNLNRQVRAHAQFDERMANAAHIAGVSVTFVTPNATTREQVAGLTTMRDSAAVRLLILADRYATAKAQTPPG